MQLCAVRKIDFRIRGYHCDAYGHVNNARYLELFEEGRWAFLQPAVDKNFFKDRGLIFVVVNINISYKKPLIPDQVVEIECLSLEYRNMSLVVTQEIRDKETGDLHSSADITFVLLTEEGKPHPVTDEIKNKFNELMSIPC